jgi:hypothetical protein
VPSLINKKTKGKTMLKKISFQDYQKINAINISSLVHIKKSPENFKWHIENRKDSKSLSIGRLLHAMILEPGLVLSNYAVGPNESDYKIVTADDLKPLCDKYQVKKGKTKSETINSLCQFLTKEERLQIYDLSYDAFLIDSNGKEIISFDDFSECKNISKKLLSDSRILKMLNNGGHPEVSIENKIDGVAVKGRIDFLSDNFFMDYKSCQDCSVESFVKDFIKYEYHIKLAFYQKLIELEKGKKIPCFVIAQSKEENFDYSIFEVDQDFLDFGYAEFLKLFDTYKNCLEKDEWKPMAKDVQILIKPAWLK